MRAAHDPDGQERRSADPARRIDTQRLLPWAALALLLALTAVVYARVLEHDLVLLDDNRYISEQPRVLAGLNASGVIWALSSTAVENWHPLTWLSYMLDVELFDADPGGFHLTNLLLHLANTWLLFAVLVRMTGARWRSLVVAALFALHPMRVESVAWVSERKDVLSGLFFRFSRSRESLTRRPQSSTSFSGGLPTTPACAPRWSS